MTLSVSTRPATARRTAEVVVTPPDGASVPLSAYEARELSRRILSAAIEVERGERTGTARMTSNEERRLRRAVDIDEQLVARDEEV